VDRIEGISGQEKVKVILEEMRPKGGVVARIRYKAEK